MLEPIGVVLLASAFVGIGDGWERAAVMLALPLLAHPRGYRLARLLLASALAALAAHLLLDNESYRLVWLYGAAAAPWHLRVGGLWAGDEATLLVLAAGCAALAPVLHRRDGWAGRGAAIVAAVFVVGALVWDPFAQASAAPRPPANPHLGTLWMAVHPPLVLAAYVLLLAPVGAALAALCRPDQHRVQAWGAVAASTVRLAWLLLSLGLVTGMAWAYEDFTFGPLWHWDPVQSAVFAVWALTTAHLHCLRAYQSSGGRTFAIAHPVLGLMSALAVLVAMAATRHPLLASSHRYVGDTSLALLVAGAAALVALTGWAMVARGKARREAPGDGRRLLTMGILGLAVMASLVLAELGTATVGQALGLVKDAAAKPYYEMLARWASAGELAALDQAFARWEPDPTAINSALLPAAIALALLAGHLLMPVPRGLARGALTACFALAALAAATAPGGPLQAAYRGSGMTASATVAALPWLDALVVALAYGAVAALARAGLGLWRFRAWPAAQMRHLLVGLAHAGMAVGLAALLAATVLDSYAQRILRWPDDFGRPVTLADGFSLTLGHGDVRWHAGEASGGGAVGYADAASAGERGPVRVMCEILDYRYARFAGGATQMITPNIDRGLWRDVQVWVGAGDPAKATAGIALVVKVYPMVTWLWLGFATAMLAAAGLYVLDRRTPVTAQKEQLA